MRERVKAELYYLTSVVLGYNALTQQTHGPLCDFSDTCRAVRRMFLYPRTHFKSTIITIAGTIQSILINPDVTILLAAATDVNAQRFLLEIERHFMNNSVLRWLYPELVWSTDREAPRWNRKEMEVRRSTYVREPTIDTTGAGSEVISRHYQRIILDDIIGEKQYGSAAEMKAVCEWLTGVESLLVPPIHERIIDAVGTRWKLDDAYSFMDFIWGGGKETPKVDLGPYAYKHGKLAVLSRPVIENGTPIFPTMFTMEQLADMQRADPMKFAAQFLNNPTAEGIASFSTSWLRYYTFDEKGLIKLEDSDTPLRQDRLQTFILCDPSLGEKETSDRCAILVVGVHLDKHPKVIMLDRFIGRISPTLIIEKLISLWQKYKWSRFVSIEVVAYQKALKYWIDQRTADLGLGPMPIAEFNPTGKRHTKAERIKGLQPLCQARQLYLQGGFIDFIEEYQSWHESAKHDDAMDCLAQLLEYFDFGWKKESWNQIEEFDRMMSEARDPLTGSWSTSDPVRHSYRAGYMV